MPIAYPTPAEPAPEPPPGAGNAGATPADERDRARTRTRVGDTTPGTMPGAASDGPSAPSDGAEGSNKGANPRARLVPVNDDTDGETDGEVVAFPGRATPRPPAVVQVWIREAKDTAGRAVDGSVYRARPPALRDSFERLRRAEWAGGNPVLLWVGRIYGAIALVIRAGLLGVCWLLDHPTRLLVAAGIAAAAIWPLTH